MKNKILILIALASILIPLASALYLDQYSIEDFFQSEIVILTIVFLILFAFVYAALLKSVFKDQKQIAAVVALGVSALITIALYTQGGIDYLLEMTSSGSQIIVTLGVIIIGIVIVWAFVKFLGKSFGK